MKLRSVTFQYHILMPADDTTTVDGMDMADIGQEVVIGEWSGLGPTVVEDKMIEGQEVIDACQKHGTDPGFFGGDEDDSGEGSDEEGSDEDDDEDDEDEDEDDYEDQLPRHNGDLG